MNLLKKIFTWWNGTTIGTNFFTWRKGTYVGSDNLGNKYYQGSCNSDGRPRRWVIYCCSSDPTLIPNGWHGWLHYRVDVAPVDEEYIEHEWQKPHEPNLTGTIFAYRPKGSIGNEAYVDKSYVAWKPPVDNKE